MTKHTPGPWIHYDDSDAPSHRHVIAAIGKTIAHVYCTKGHEEKDAINARLIAAAPELLEALIGLQRDHCRAYCDDRDVEIDIAHTEECCAARAAIAKAKP